MKTLERTLSLGRAALRRAWIGLLVAACLTLGWLLRGGLAPAEEHAAPAAGAATAAPQEAAPQVWTCSMDPQVRRPAPGACPICGMDLIPLEAGAGGGPRELSMSAAARALAGIRTAPVERRAVEAEVRMVGKLDYDETRLAYITAWVGGRIDRLFVDYTGVEVKQGEHLVELYSPALYAAQEELLQALRAVGEIERRGASELEGMARTTLAAAREKLRLWGLQPGQIAEIEARGEAGTTVTVYAPSSGIVIHKSVQQGMYVDVGTPIYTIADLSRLWVRLEAYESDLPWLRYGQEVRFTTQAWPGETFHGTIAFIDPVLDPRTRTIKVRVNVDNPERKLKPEMFVRARVRAEIAAGGRVMDASLAGKWICPMHPEIVKDGPDACDLCGMDLVTPESLGYVTEDAGAAPLPLVIPAGAPLLTGRRAVVYVELEGQDGPRFEGREVVLGPRAGDHYLVARGLAEGERVVVEGAFKIDSSLQIQARPSMMLPEGGGAAGAADGAAASPLLARGLERVEAGARALEAAAAADEPALDEVRTAFEALREAVDALDAAALAGAEAADWRELAMRLGNDAAVGAEANDLAAAREALDSARGTLTRMRERFGHHAREAPAQHTTPPAFRAELGAVLRAYLELHAALAGDDLAAARPARERVARALEQVDPAPLDAAARAAWGTRAEALAAALDAAARAEDLDAVRAAFEPLSDGLKAALEAFGADLGPVLEVRCPMAFDGRGASWLQTDPAVLNPYFGDSMLRCGSVLGALVQPAEHDHDR